MTRISPALLGFLAAPLLALVACDDNAPPPPPPASPPASPPPVKAEPPAPPVEVAVAVEVEQEAKGAQGGAPPAVPLVIPGVGEPGPAFVAVDNKGVVRIDGGALTRLEGAPETGVRSLRLGGDGALWASSMFGLFRLEGERMREVTRGKGDNFQVLASGEIWAHSYDAVHHFDGSAWSEESAAAIGAGEEPLKGIVVHEDGRVFVASGEALFVRDLSGAWGKFDVLQKFRGPNYFDVLTSGPTGELYLVGYLRLLRISPEGQGAAEPVKMNVGFGSLSDVKVAGDGTVAARNIYDLHVRAPDGKIKVVRARKDFAGEQVVAWAVADGGRLWVATDAGVTVTGGGQARVDWPMGSLPEIAGSVRAFAVLGAGPSSIPGAGTVRMGGLRGRIMREELPVGGLDVEICPTPDLVYTKTPCTGSPNRLKAKADSDGVWTLKDVPLGSYGVAVKVGRSWQITMGAVVREAMQEGLVLDTGDLRLAAEEKKGAK
ncbi:MAG: hypothetical protein IPK80_15310 [Nannocystis sp.]|nr:hypothetical protein [Nannocystis sp.]